MIKAVRGTRDLLPPATDLWNQVDAKVRDVFSRYNYHEIRTPIFEDTQLFSRSVGEETDIVSKEMFTWDNGRPIARTLEVLWRDGDDPVGPDPSGFGRLYQNLRPYELEIGDFQYLGVRDGLQHIILIRDHVDSRIVDLIRQHQKDLEVPGIANLPERRFVVAVPA